MFSWPLILHSWTQDKTSAAEVLRKRGFLTASERVAQSLQAPVGMFEPCLSVLDGHPVRYGVSVVARHGQTPVSSAVPQLRLVTPQLSICLPSWSPRPLPCRKRG